MFIRGERVTFRFRGNKWFITANTPQTVRYATQKELLKAVEKSSAPMMLEISLSALTIKTTSMLAREATVAEVLQYKRDQLRTFESSHRRKLQERRHLALRLQSYKQAVADAEKKLAKPAPVKSAQHLKVEQEVIKLESERNKEVRKARRLATTVVDPGTDHDKAI